MATLRADETLQIVLQGAFSLDDAEDDPPEKPLVKEGSERANFFEAIEVVVLNE